jgi:hypothetical protein
MTGRRFCFGAGFIAWVDSDEIESEQLALFPSPREAGRGEAG